MLLIFLSKFGLPFYGTRENFQKNIRCRMKWDDDSAIDGIIFGCMSYETKIIIGRTDKLKIIYFLSVLEFS